MGHTCWPHVILMVRASYCASIQNIYLIYIKLIVHAKLYLTYPKGYALYIYKVNM